MGKQFNKISTALTNFIEAQKMFFVGTARREGTVNISPKGMDSFKVINPNRVVWLNLTGSGNETATHLLESNRMTIMFCAFEGSPLILRLYGTAKVYHERDEAFKSYQDLFPPHLGLRQIIEMEVDLVQTSCGYGIPILAFQEERTRLTEWAAEKGEEGIKTYWTEKNSISLDGHPTKIFGEESE